MRTEKNEFDTQIGKILSDAREEVPGRLWEGVCARMDAKASPAGWVVTARRFGYGLLAAAAAVALFFTVSGLLNTENNNADTYSKNYSLAEVTAPEQGVEPAEEVTTEAPSVQEESKVVVHAGAAQPRNEAAQPSPVSVAEAPAELIASTLPAEEIPSEEEEVVEEVVIAEVAAVEDLPVAPETPSSSEVEYDADEDSPHRFGKKIGITIGGNRQNNGISSTSPAITPMRRAAAASASVPTESSVKETDISTYMMPLTFGLGVHIPISNIIGVTTGLSYTFLHRNFGGAYTRVSGGEVSRIESDDIDHNLHYLGVPVGLYFTIFGTENKVRLYGFASGMIERAISNKYVIHTPGKAYTITKKLDGFQFSVAGGFGLEYRISNHFGIYLDPSIRYYFDCDQPKNIRTQQPWMMGLELGLRFNL